ncbi:MAG: ABC transporter permease [Pseudonocardiaceae bacterium]
MNLREALRVALAALAANRLRSALSMFGILMGVAAVILLVAFGNGTSLYVSNQVQSLGSNLIVVFPSNERRGGVSQGFGTGQTLTEEDVQALSDPSQAPNVATVMPITVGNVTLQYQNQNWLAEVTGATQDFALMQDRDMSAGFFFTDAEVRGSSKVVVIGQTVVDNLFGGDPAAAIGQSVKIQRQPFRVTGVFAVEGAGGFSNPDNVAVIPITTGWNYLLGGRGKNITLILAQAVNADAVEAALQETTQVLLTTHKISNLEEADFQVQSQQGLLAQLNQITGILTIFLALIAAISLAVGGIGIMNIMLVTVTERTREIGIRKAIGAKRKDVLMQFLIESALLAGIGGLLGIAAGVGLSALITSVIQRLGGGSFPVPVVSLSSVVLAFAVSVGIGLFFGIYPASRAAKLRPIEALRYE